MWPVGAAKCSGGESGVVQLALARRLLPDSSGRERPSCAAPVLALPLPRLSPVRVEVKEDGGGAERRNSGKAPGHRLGLGGRVYHA